MNAHDTCWAPRRTPHPRPNARLPHPHPRNAAPPPAPSPKVVNFEEGSEASFHHGDNITEVVLTDGARSFGAGVRNMGAESLFEYGSRVGFSRSNANVTAV